MDYVFPNETYVHWTVMIVLYPYLSGLVVGTYIVSTLPTIFRRDALRPIARFALVASLILLLFTPLPLLIHLGRPERALYIMSTPNPSSAMAGFGVVYSVFLVLAVLQIWFSLRSEFVARAKGSGAVALLCRILVLGDLNDDASIRAADARLTRVVAGLGIPVACILTGYVGFMFGTIKANPWWSTPMMFVIFVISALVSGAAVLLVAYLVLARISGWTPEPACVRSLGRYLWGFLLVAVPLELLEILSAAYKRTHEWDLIRELITKKLFVSYVVLQFAVLALIPFILLTITNLSRLRARLHNALSFIAALMLLGQVFAMRWNVVIGGQYISKSYRGLMDYEPKWFEKEGLVTAIVVITVPWLALWVFNRIVPLFPAHERK